MGFLDKEFERENNHLEPIPSKLVTEILKYKKEGTVLEIGVGEGRNALFLAKKGFNVTGIDISIEKMNKFLNSAEKLGLHMKGELIDVRDYKFVNKFDAIVSTATLHFLERKDIVKIVKKIKENTEEGGINCISVFTEDNPFKKFPYLFKKNELKSLYDDWEILDYKEIITPLEKHPENDKPHRHAVAVLIARKI